MSQDLITERKGFEEDPYLVGEESCLTRESSLVYFLVFCFFFYKITCHY